MAGELDGFSFLDEDEDEEKPLSSLPNNFTFDEADDDEVRISVQGALSKNPDQHLNVIKQSEKSGIPIQTVERNLDKVTSQNKYSDIDLNSIKTSNPTLWRVLKDQNRAAVIQDDIPFFQSVENWYKENQNYNKFLRERFHAGQANVRASELGMQSVWAAKGIGEPLTEEQKAEIQQHIQDGKRVPDYDTSDTLPLVAEQLPILANIIGEGLKTGAVGGVGGAIFGATSALVGGQLGPQAATPEEIVTVPAAALAFGGKGFVAGGKIGTAVAAFNLEGGLAMTEFQQMEGITPELAADAAIAVGAVNAGLEFISLTFLGKTFSPARKLIMQRFKQAMVTESGREIIKKLAANYAAAVAGEGITEFLQETMTIIGGEALELFGDDSFDDDSIGQLIDNIFTDDNIHRMQESGIAGLKVSAVLSSVGTATSAVMQHQSNKFRSDDEQSRIDRIAGAVNDSVMKNRSVDEIRQFMQEASDEYGNDEAVYIPAEAFENIDLELFTGKAGEAIKAQVQQAIELGSDVVVPMADFVADVVTNDQLFGQIRNDIRLSTDTLTNNEAGSIDAEQKQKLQQMVETATKNVELMGQADSIWKEVQQAIVATGRQSEAIAGVSARIIPAYVVTRATRTGKTVEQVYEEMGIKIVGPKEDLSPIDGETILDQVDPLTEAGDWRDAVVQGVMEDGTQEDIKAGEAMDIVTSRLETARNLLDCINASS